MHIFGRVSSFLVVSVKTVFAAAAAVVVAAAAVVVVAVVIAAAVVVAVVVIVVVFVVVFVAAASVVVVVDIPFADVVLLLVTGVIYCPSWLVYANEADSS